MKKAIVMAMAFCLVASFAFAQGASPVVTETLTLKGDIIDNMCAGAQKPEGLADFVKTHSKQCAISPDCEKAGYSIFADGKLSKFSAESNVRIAEFLKKEDSKLQVVVTASKVGQELILVSIENQQ